MKNLIFITAMIYVIVGCNYIPVAGPGGVSGKDALKQLDEAQSMVGMTSILSLFSTFSQTA